MKFSEVLFSLLKRISTIEVAHGTTVKNEDGELELELIVIADGEIEPIAWLSESATPEEIENFIAELDCLEKASAEQRVEDEATAEKVREVLSRLTKEERMLIERPLPEDIPTAPVDPDFCEYL